MEVSKAENSGIILPISNLYSPESLTQESVISDIQKKAKKPCWYFESEDGMEPPTPVGDKMVVEVYFPEMSDGGLALAEEYQIKLKFSSVVGRVIKLGSACFKGERFQYWDRVPKVGEWITFKANPSSLLNYRGIPIFTMFDDFVNSIIEKPEYVERC